MRNTFLVITSIGTQDHPVLIGYAAESIRRKVHFILVGDIKSPDGFIIDGCDFYSIKRQKTLEFQLAAILPLNHYARKNLGYLVAISKGAEIIVETDDDNLPYETFWDDRIKRVDAYLLKYGGWVNVYRYFTSKNVWPRGFPIEWIKAKPPDLNGQISVICPIQQGLVDENPDVDAIYRCILPLPIRFNKSESVAIGADTFCPFNSQNTTWFKEAFPLLYLPSSCSFRMTDIWRSFVAQRISWTCNWSILFHHSTLWQRRNDHNLRNDFIDEISGYKNNDQIFNCFKKLNLQEGIDNIPTNMILCYQELVQLGLIETDEIELLKAWLDDIHFITKQHCGA